MADCKFILSYILNIICKTKKHKIVNIKESPNKSSQKPNISNRNPIIWKSILIDKNEKKIKVEAKDLLVGFKESLSSIIPNIRSESNINNTSITSDSLIKPNILRILRS